MVDSNLNASARRDARGRVVTRRKREREKKSERERGVRWPWGGAGVVARYARQSSAELETCGFAFHFYTRVQLRSSLPRQNNDALNQNLRFLSRFHARDYSHRSIARPLTQLDLELSGNFCNRILLIGSFSRSYSPPVVRSVLVAANLKCSQSMSTLQSHLHLQLA